MLASSKYILSLLKTIKKKIFQTIPQNFQIPFCVSTESKRCLSRHQLYQNAVPDTILELQRNGNCVAKTDIYKKMHKTSHSYDKFMQCSILANIYETYLRNKN